MDILLSRPPQRLYFFLLFPYICQLGLNALQDVLEL